jgi:glycosyltransferase involved in cell wall biosynthesis
VINDKSTDSTLEILKEFESRVTVLQGSGTGAGPARNLGIRRAKSDYIAFLDADDVWDPDKIAEQLPYLAQGVVVGAYARYVTGAKSRKIGTSIRTLDDHEANEMLLNKSGMPSLLSSWVMKKSDIDENGLFDPNFRVAQDYEFIMRHVKSGLRMVIVRKPLLEYQIHGLSETSTVYIQQYLTAYYIKKGIEESGSIELSDWLEIAKANKRLMRSARAGFLFRKALVNAGSPWGYHQVVFNLMASAVLDPIEFRNKLRRQGPSFRNHGR